MIKIFVNDATGMHKHPEVIEIVMDKKVLNKSNGRITKSVSNRSLNGLLLRDARLELQFVIYYICLRLLIIYLYKNLRKHYTDKEWMNWMKNILFQLQYSQQCNRSCAFL